MLVKCLISPGLRESEVIAHVIDTNNRTHYIRVEHDFLSYYNNIPHLPIAIIEQSDNKVLIEFTHEAETGANRIWVNTTYINEKLECQ